MGHRARRRLSPNRGKTFRRRSRKSKFFSFWREFSFALCIFDAFFVAKGILNARAMVRARLECLARRVCPPPQWGEKKRGTCSIIEQGVCITCRRSRRRGVGLACFYRPLYYVNLFKKKGIKIKKKKKKKKKK